MESKEHTDRMTKYIGRMNKRMHRFGRAWRGLVGGLEDTLEDVMEDSAWE